MACKRVAAISGASRGIGFNTAGLLEQAGYCVYNLSPAGEEAHFNYIPCDVRDIAAVHAAFARIKENEGRLDLLICNAGYGIAGAIEDTAIEQAEQQFAVNFFGACACIQHALPALRESCGRVILVSSLAAVLPLPFQAYYSASKAALNALASALAHEIKPFGVSVAAVLPGDAQSTFTAMRVKTLATDSVYNERAARSLAVMEHDEQTGMTSAYVAQKIAALAAKKRLRLFYTIGGQYQLFYMLQKLLPLSFVRFIVGKIYAK
jgi:NAD(P)-dependent dehydrogenase (short-subunit alcohol dehydrogenase family)